MEEELLVLFGKPDNVSKYSFENSCCVCHVVLRGSGLELVCPRELTCFVRIPWKMSQEDLGYDKFIERERVSKHCDLDLVSKPCKMRISHSHFQWCVNVRHFGI